jgi:imidazolonepropionase-like amidohydrolase
VPPASALFADNMWYKTEAYLGSPYAAKILNDNGLVPIFVSDNPVLNAQHVVFEAAKGYRYGLPYHVALAAVTTAPAFYVGMGNRLGKVKPGFDADIVVWDSDPLEFGAAPVQVWIDGTAQFEDPVELNKSYTRPIVPDPKLEHTLEEPVQMKDVVFTGVSRVLLQDDERVAGDESLAVVVRGGKISCVGTCTPEIQTASESGTPIVELENGHLTLAFTAFGGQLGLTEIDAEPFTSNGPDAGYNVFSRGVDGLSLDTKKLLAAHRWGVTRAISAPRASGNGLSPLGTSTGFRTAAKTVLEDEAVWCDDVAVHYTLQFSEAKNPVTPSMSAAVGALRTKLLEAATSNTTIANPLSEAAFLRKVVSGQMVLVIHVHSADFIAAALQIKAAVDRVAPSPLRLAVHGGAESHVLARELAAAGVGVILAPFLPYRESWDQRRALTGAPLTNGTAVDALAAAGVKVAVGIDEDWTVRDVGFAAAIAFRNGGGRISVVDSLLMVSRNLYEILGVGWNGGGDDDFLVWEGSPMEISSRIRGVGCHGLVDVFV